MFALLDLGLLGDAPIGGVAEPVKELIVFRFGLRLFLLEALVDDRRVANLLEPRQSALHLARDYGVERCREQLFEVVKNPRRERLHGLAAAALFDLGAHDAALDAVRAAEKPRKLPELAWATMVRAGASGFELGPLVTESRYRRIQLGWVE